MSQNNNSKLRATNEKVSGVTEEQIYGIKKYTKMNFKELLHKRKLSKAVEIIDFIGYENPSYFYKIFKEKFKVMIREYKLNLQKN